MISYHLMQLSDSLGCYYLRTKKKEEDTDSDCQVQNFKCQKP